MRVLWLCNVIFSDIKIAQTGTWLQPLAEKLSKSSNVELINITFGNNISVCQSNYGSIEQWLIPRKKRFEPNYLIHTSDILYELIQKTKPDFVHIWGTENLWTNLLLKKDYKIPLLLEIQGLLSEYSKFYLGNLLMNDILRSIHIKEILLPNRNLISKQYQMYKKGIAEKSIIKSFKYISTQSEWSKSNIKFINRYAELYSTKIILRALFYTAKPWLDFEHKTEKPIIFSSVSAAIPYKGLHILIRAVAILQKIYPSIELRLAGNIIVGNKIKDGYSIYLQKLIKNLGLAQNVTILGSLDSEKIVKELQIANVCVVPSFVETYCLALAEAMYIGTPCVISYAGAMPEFAHENEEALFYNSADYVMLASLIEKLIFNKTLSADISMKARILRMKVNDPDQVVKTQIDIYKQIIEKEYV